MSTMMNTVVVMRQRERENARTMIGTVYVYRWCWYVCGKEIGERDMHSWNRCDESNQRTMVELKDRIKEKKKNSGGDGGSSGGIKAVDRDEGFEDFWRYDSPTLINPLIPLHDSISSISESHRIDTMQQ